MKIDRLLGITIYLLNHGVVSAGTLAEEFEVSVRTILRDIETLGFGNGVKVLEPDDLKERLKNMAKDIYELYHM